MTLAVAVYRAALLEADRILRERDLDDDELELLELVLEAIAAEINAQ